MLSEALVIPPDEKRILASMEKQSMLGARFVDRMWKHPIQHLILSSFFALPNSLGSDKIRQHAAATLIQAAWQQYVFERDQTKADEIASNHDISLAKKLKIRYER